MAVLVRKLRETDKEQWQRLFKGYLTFYEASLEDSVIDLTFQRLLGNKAGTHRALVAQINGGADDNTIIGFAHYLIHRSTWSKTWYCYMEDLFVDPTVRRTGAGKALIEAVYAAADKIDCTRVYWVTQDFNTTARALYDQVSTKSPFIQYRR